MDGRSKVDLPFLKSVKGLTRITRLFATTWPQMTFAMCTLLLMMGDSPKMSCTFTRFFGKKKQSRPCSHKMCRAMRRFQ